MALARFVVGIDLGTTNSALAYVDTGVGEEEAVRPTHLFIPQVVQPGSGRGTTPFALVSVSAWTQ